MNGKGPNDWPRVKIMRTLKDARAEVKRLRAESPVWHDATIGAYLPGLDAWEIIASGRPPVTPR